MLADSLIARTRVRVRYVVVVSPFKYREEVKWAEAILIGGAAKRQESQSETEGSGGTVGALTKLL